MSNLISLCDIEIGNLLKEFHMKMESLSQRKLELEKKEVQLKESVVKFDKFLKVILIKNQPFINNILA